MRPLRAFVSAACIAAAVLVVLPRSTFAYGEIFALKAPEEIPEGDDIGITVTASLKEQWVDRAVVLDVPANWHLKRAYAVVAGSDVVLPLPSTSQIAQFFGATKSRSVIAFADTNTSFDPDAAGIAYFFVFGNDVTNAVSAQLKAVLVERNDPSTPPEIDKKTKKPKPINTDWKQVFPFKPEFSFADIAGKRSVQSIRLLKNWRIGRALTLEGSKHADAKLHTQEAAVAQLFSKPYSIEFWFKTLEPNGPIFTLDSADHPLVAVSTGALGQILVLQSSEDHPVLETRSIVADGIWHHFAYSVDSSDQLRVFIDAVPFGSVQVSRPKVSGLTLGSANHFVAVSIDEFHLFKRAFVAVQDFQASIVSSPRDTLESAFALFHLNDFGRVAHSSIGVRVGSGEEGTVLPIILDLDSNARITDASSPVQTDQVVLSAELISPTKISIGWRTTSELGIKEYQLEQRIGNYGKFQKVLTIEAKHGMKTPKRGSSIVYRNAYLATEPLPAIRGDIDLYYRIAIVGFGEPVRYSEPVKIGYGGERDVFVEQNAPNPFNPTTTIAFRLEKSEYVTLTIYDIIGRQVMVVASGKMSAGRHSFDLDASTWPGGIYFYKVKTPQSTVTRKMVLAK